jgi:hypothetical protein
MIRVDKIVEIKPFYVICCLNNGISKKLDVASLIEKHANLKGIGQLKDVEYLKSAAIGELGEIFWKDTIETAQDEKWNYDISPEFIFYHGLNI